MKPMKKMNESTWEIYLIICPFYSIISIRRKINFTQ